MTEMSIRGSILSSKIFENGWVKQRAQKMLRWYIICGFQQVQKEFPVLRPDRLYIGTVVAQPTVWVDEQPRNFKQASL